MGLKVQCLSLKAVAQLELPLRRKLYSSPQKKKKKKKEGEKLNGRPEEHSNGLRRYYFLRNNEYHFETQLGISTIILGGSSLKDTCRSELFWSQHVLPCTTVCITHLWGGFPSSIARQPRGCQYRTISLRIAL